MLFYLNLRYYLGFLNLKSRRTVTLRERVNGMCVREKKISFNYYLEGDKI